MWFLGVIKTNMVKLFGVVTFLYSTRSQSALFDAPFWLRLRQSQKKCSTAWQAAKASAPLRGSPPRLAQKCAVKNAHILTALSIHAFFSIHLPALTLDPIAAEVNRRNLPAVLLEDIKTYGRWDKIRVLSGDRDSYIPWNNTIYVDRKQYERGPQQWTASDWADFYNELFSAWWDNVFRREPGYGALYSQLLADYKQKYIWASPSHPSVAQEEAYSETVSAVIFLIALRVRSERLYYKKNWTVEPVGHSDRPGFTKEAENIYPDISEYNHVFTWLTGHPPPPIPDLAAN